MKFMLHIVPTVPASPIERERLRPIAHRTGKIQQMLDEMVELAQLAEDVGFSAVTYSEHHFYTEGLEAGATPTPHLINLLLKTKRIMIGPMGFVLPTWDPIRLALDVAWADQISKGRVLVGFARGVFPRWVNVLGQHYGAQPGALGPEADKHNREVFEELFKIVKLSWADEPFSFNGRYYQVPFPSEGHEWLPAEATARYGAPGELDQNGWLRRVSPVPKPYQKPHPPLFQALSRTEATIRWAAREGVVPAVFLPFPQMALEGARFYSEEAAKAGRNVPVGRSIGLARMIYAGDTREQAMERARNGSVFLFRQFHAKFEKQIPTSIEPFIEAGLAFVGTADDLSRRMGEVEATLDPEWFMMICDQGFMPIHEIKQQIELFGTKVMPQFMG
ncbi:MAG TPA: LLM class flavin-dependent oxidoreductase [Candidatus Binataceae bacterium]|nr:LLM class flavin-dependent oxidoreductase [Candidatus Binataceae bacterium]